MTDPKNIPHLINLLDDESDLVRTNVIKELAAFGPNLSYELRKLKLAYSPIQEEFIQTILHDQKRRILSRTWSNWFYMKEGYTKLEMALSMLADYLSPPDQPSSLKEVLDDLAFTYRQMYRRADVRLLAQFLFEAKGLKGDEEDYYNPQNSNLIYVVEEKKGIPISLVCIYLLVGHRLGLKIDGCNFPGHFLAKVRLNKQTLFVDCFSGGQFINKGDLLQVKEELLGDLDSILNEKADVGTIIRRFLANLIRAFQVSDEEPNSDFMIHLFKGMDDHTSILRMADLTPEEIIAQKHPILARGMIVRHLLYGYRGIIVDIDSECTASDSWYYGNQTQPDRNQPWYHILVNGSDQVTYVAENNLMFDHSPEPIIHPLLSYFFLKGKDGKYTRNENPWPETDFEE
ncbi:MAG TPA: heat shock protein HspQ [Candidatus Omnitrophota bacterium]|nr:heat shock protein HspQ [Candidatus Omnitrophota bacterium]